MSIVKNLSIDWDDFHLQIPEIDLLDRGITGLLGPSGAGKSTIVKVLLGLYPSSGLSWIFRGEDIALKPTRDRHLGIVFQDNSLFPHLTARANIWFAAKARGHSGADAEKLFSEVTAALGIQDILQRKAHVLSGGERQRVTLARALMGQPRFLFLDEPFSALDADNRDQARALIKEVLERFQVPALLITHDRDDLRALADKVYQLKNSQLSTLEIASL